MAKGFKNICQFFTRISKEIKNIYQNQKDKHGNKENK